MKFDIPQLEKHVIPPRVEFSKVPSFDSVGLVV